VHPAKNASDAERFKYNTAVGASLTPLAAGQVSLQRYLDILDAVKNKRSQIFADPVERKIATDLKKAGEAYGQFGNEAKAALDKMKGAMVDTSFEGKKASSGILLNWQSMMRLLEVQFLHVFISRVIGTFKQVTRDAIEFQKGISEIRTISQDVDQSFTDLSQGARAAAMSTGFALKDVVEATYETTSNQIAKGNQAIAHIQQVGSFAKTTAATMADGINLIDGVLNAYHMNVERTAQVQAQLFKTIDLGRLRTKEIATSYGNVTSIASELGVSLEEVNASMARLTIQGIKPAVAMTLLENLMVKLIKPTDAMKEMLKSWGYETGTAAIAALGFAGVIQKMAQETETNKAKFGELFNTMRGLRGIFGITSDMEKYKDTVDKIKNSYKDYVEAQKRIQESPGMKLSLEFERIKTFLTTDFGSSAVNLIVKMTDAFGGLNKMVSSLLPELVKLGTAVLAMKTFSVLTDRTRSAGFWDTYTDGARKYAKAAIEAKYYAQDFANAQNITFNKDKNGRATGFQLDRSIMDGPAAERIFYQQEGQRLAKNYNAALDQLHSKTGRVMAGIRNLASSVKANILSVINPIGLSIGAAIYTVQTILAHHEKMKTLRETLTAENIQQYQKDTEAFTVAETTKLDILNETTKKQFQGVLQYLAAQSRAYEKHLSLLEEHAIEISESIKVTTKGLTDDLQQNLNRINSEITKSKSTIESITKQMASDSADKDKRAFDLLQEREGSGANKIVLMHERINKLKAEAIEIDAKRSEAQELRNRAAGLTDPNERQKMLEAAQKIDEQYSYESSHSKLKEAEDLLKKVNGLYVAGMNKREKLEEALDKARVKQAQHVAAAEAEVELNTLREKHQQMLLATGLYTEGELRAIKDKINAKKSEIKTLRLKLVADEDTQKINELIEKLEDLNKLKAIDIRFGGLEGLQNQLDGIVSGVMKKVAEGEIERQKKQKELLDMERDTALKRSKEAELIIAALDKVKIVDSAGKFQDVARGIKGLAFLNDATPGSIDTQIKDFAAENQLSFEEATKRFPEAAGSAFADYYREQSQKVLDIMRESGAGPADILKAQMAFQAKAEALQLEATQRVAKKISEIYTRTFVEIRDSLIAERGKEGHTFATAFNKVGEADSKIRANFGNLTESFKWSLSLSSMQGTSWWNSGGKIGKEFERFTNFIKASADLDQKKTLLDVAQKDKNTPVTQLAQLQKDVAKAEETLNSFGDVATIVKNYLDQVDTAITNLDAYVNSKGDFTAGKTTAKATVEDLKKQRAEAMQAFQTFVNGPREAAERERRIAQATESLNKYQTSLQDVGSAAAQASKEIPELVKQLDAIGEAVRITAEKIKNFNDNNPLPKVGPGRAMGGPIGSDTLLTPTTAGEYVMNRNAAQEFYPLLAAMNGQVSAGLSLGGSINVGDVNINLNSSGNSKVDARAIGMELRGLIRQGLLNLNS
jgi:TP901 family phage tail tape measure protein